MKAIWLTTSIWQNKLRLIYLISLLPLIVILTVFIYLLFIHPEINDAFWNDFYSINIVWLPILAIWLFIWVLNEKNIIFSFTWAKEVTRKQEPEIYNIVENLCISKWLPIPKIGIMEDSSMNAYATGWTTKNSWIVFSRWLLKSLDKKELEAVSGHELTHIINWDIKNMVIINVFIWAIWTIWYILIRTGSAKKSWNSKWWNPLPLLWLLLYLASIILLPLINLAISRKKEFLADAWSVVLTKDSLSMISALKKISKDSVIEKISDNWRNIASMFISNPRSEPKFFANIRNLFSTHPTIEDRISALKKY